MRIPNLASIVLLGTAALRFSPAEPLGTGSPEVGRGASAGLGSVSLLQASTPIDDPLVAYIRAASLGLGQ